MLQLNTRGWTPRSFKSCSKSTWIYFIQDRRCCLIILLKFLEFFLNLPLGQDIKPFDRLGEKLFCCLERFEDYPHYWWLSVKTEVYQYFSFMSGLWFAHVRFNPNHTVPYFLKERRTCWFLPKSVWLMLSYLLSWVNLQSVFLLLYNTNR